MTKKTKKTKKSSKTKFSTTTSNPEPIIISTPDNIPEATTIPTINISVQNIINRPPEKIRITERNFLIFVKNYLSLIQKNAIEAYQFEQKYNMDGFEQKIHLYIIDTIANQPYDLVSATAGLQLCEYFISKNTYLKGAYGPREKEDYALGVHNFYNKLFTHNINNSSDNPFFSSVKPILHSSNAVAFVKAMDINVWIDESASKKIKFELIILLHNNIQQLEVMIAKDGGLACSFTLANYYQATIDFYTKALLYSNQFSDLMQATALLELKNKFNEQIELAGKEARKIDSISIKCQPFELMLLNAQTEIEQQTKEDANLKAKEEAARKAKEEAERKAKEEAERKAKEEAARKAKEEAERKAREEAERKAKEEAERKAREEAERKAKEEAERKAREEAARKAKEEAARKAREEAARKAREKAEYKDAVETEGKTSTKKLKPKIGTVKPQVKNKVSKQVQKLQKKKQKIVFTNTPVLNEKNASELDPENKRIQQDEDVRRKDLEKFREQFLEKNKEEAQETLTAPENIADEWIAKQIDKNKCLFKTVEKNSPIINQLNENEKYLKSLSKNLFNPNFLPEETYFLLINSSYAAVNKIQEIELRMQELKIKKLTTSAPTEEIEFLKKSTTEFFNKKESLSNLLAKQHNYIKESINKILDLSDENKSSEIKSDLLEKLQTLELAMSPTPLSGSSTPNTQLQAELKAKEEAILQAAENFERMATRKAQVNAERKAKEEAERKAKEEAERKAREEAERKAKEEAARKGREEAARKARAELARKAQVNADPKAKPQEQMDNLLFNQKEENKSLFEKINANIPLIKQLEENEKYLYLLSLNATDPDLYFNLLDDKACSIITEAAQKTEGLIKEINQHIQKLELYNSKNVTHKESSFLTKTKDVLSTKKESFLTPFVKQHNYVKKTINDILKFYDKNQNIETMSSYLKILQTIDFTMSKIPSSEFSKINIQLQSELKAKNDLERIDIAEALRRVTINFKRKARRVECKPGETERKDITEAKRKITINDVRRAERKAREETERKAREETERKAREETGRKLLEEAEHKAKEKVFLKTDSLSKSTEEANNTSIILAGKLTEWSRNQKEINETLFAKIDANAALIKKLEKNEEYLQMLTHYDQNLDYLLTDKVIAALKETAQQAINLIEEINQRIQGLAINNLINFTQEEQQFGSASKETFVNKVGIFSVLVNKQHDHVKALLNKIRKINDQGTSQVAFSNYIKNLQDLEIYFSSFSSLSKPSVLSTPSPAITLRKTNTSNAQITTTADNNDAQHSIDKESGELEELKINNKVSVKKRKKNSLSDHTKKATPQKLAKLEVSNNSSLDIKNTTKSAQLPKKSEPVTKKPLTKTRIKDELQLLEQEELLRLFSILNINPTPINLNTTINLPRDIRKILSDITEAGFESYVTGDCIIKILHDLPFSECVILTTCPDGCIDKLRKNWKNNSSYSVNFIAYSDEIAIDRCIKTNLATHKNKLGHSVYNFSHDTIFCDFKESCGLYATSENSKNDFINKEIHAISHQSLIASLDTVKSLLSLNKGFKLRQDDINKLISNDFLVNHFEESIRKNLFSTIFEGIRDLSLYYVPHQYYYGASPHDEQANLCRFVSLCLEDIKSGKSCVDAFELLLFLNESYLKNHSLYSKDLIRMFTKSIGETVLPADRIKSLDKNLTNIELSYSYQTLQATVTHFAPHQLDLLKTIFNINFSVQPKGDNELSLNQHKNRNYLPSCGAARPSPIKANSEQINLQNIENNDAGESACDSPDKRKYAVQNKK